MWCHRRDYVMQQNFKTRESRTQLWWVSVWSLSHTLQLSSATLCNTVMWLAAVCVWRQMENNSTLWVSVDSEYWPCQALSLTWEKPHVARDHQTETTSQPKRHNQTTTQWSEKGSVSRHHCHQRRVRQKHGQSCTMESSRPQTVVNFHHSLVYTFLSSLMKFRNTLLRAFIVLIPHTVTLQTSFALVRIGFKL